jgi:ubiquinone/menaquinone biosynthesis C-methylase UbiE
MTTHNASGDRLYIDPDLVQFYDLENDWTADCAYCRDLAKQAKSVLDLGCGTGRLAAALSEGRQVTGVDPAAAMLDIARNRPGGAGVTWIEGDARSLRLNRRFDLVLLTGHAFQVFLTAQDQEAALATIAAHLGPQGRFIFDTRNPNREEWLEWTPQHSERFIDHPQFGHIKAWNDVRRDPVTGVVTYDTFYEIAGTGQRYAATSKIAFPSREALAEMCTKVGLTVDQWLGDWEGGAYTAASKEIIPIGRLG